MTTFYEVKFTYKDDKDMNVNMVPEKLHDFFQSLNDKRIFWYGEDKENPETGFWTNLDDIRFVRIQLMKGETHEPSTENSHTDTEVDDVACEEEAA